MTSPPKTEPAPSTAFAVALLTAFVDLGVREVVVSPGSRSQALALAAAALADAGRLQLRVRIDERVAGFLALGTALETGVPALVITTSGTAVANLHPAVLEAHHSGVPMIVLSADRPAELRSIGSNQTTQQVGIFGPAVLNVVDVVAPTGEPGEQDAAAVLAANAFGAVGPVQLNLAFTEPLSSPFTLPPLTDSVPESVETEGSARSDSPFAPAGGETRLQPEPGTVVIAGSGAGAIAEEIAHRLAAPLFAEVSSGAHFGPNLVVTYRELLHSPLAADIRRVIVFGRPTLSREVPALIQRDGVETIVVTRPGTENYNPGHRVETFVPGVEVQGVPDAAWSRSWPGRWVAASRDLLLQGDVDSGPDIEADATAHAKGELVAVRTAVTRRSLVEAVWRATWPHDRLVLGASRLIRELDRVAVGKRVTVHANRGLAGIDGTISTAVGVALASQDDPANQGTTRVLLGDLTLLHDVGALLFGVGEVRPRLQVIVGDDGGGTIFDGLEVAQSAGANFDRVMYTPQRIELEQLAAAYGWDYRRVDTRGGLDQALTASVAPTIVHVPLPR